MCCSICDIGVPGKWQTWKDSMSASNFVLIWEKFYRNFQNVESNFWRADSGKTTSLEWYADFKSSMSSVEDAEQWRQPSVSKLHENVDYVKEFILLNKRTTVCEVTNILGISLGLVQRAMKDEWSESVIQEIGFSTLTTHLLTPLCLYLKFRPRNKMTVPRPLYLLDLLHGLYLPKS